MKTILVTGATGFLGSNLVDELLKNTNDQVIAISGKPNDNSFALPDTPHIKTISLEGFFDSNFEGVDTIINCAFPRSHDLEVLADALSFTERLIDKIRIINPTSVINISTQGVYKRMPQGTLSTEESPILPVDLYSLLKLSVEKLFNVSGIKHITNVRLASLYMKQRFLYRFIQQAKSGETIVLTAPNQYASLLDVSDAASGLVAITRIPPADRAKIYNLGTGQQYSLKECIERIKEVGGELGYSVNYSIQDQGITTCAGMAINKLQEDSGWSPKIHLDELIHKAFS